jgi:NAD(P)-dependent dehydrogenase (short-subunit alcohol dehydrogenase family)
MLATPETLARALDDVGIPLLINADPAAEPAAIIARSSTFAAAHPPGTEGLIVTLLPANDPVGEAALHAFTRQAALAWAPSRLRVNAIALGHAASLADLLATIRAMAGWPSMTGQLIRLGA